MRITKVRAEAFGALFDQELRLGPGLNVVAGPNSAGKSTWHAAMYALLFGSPGGGIDQDLDARFREKWRPYFPPGQHPLGFCDGWAVSGDIEPYGGQPAPIRRDLDGPPQIDTEVTTRLGLDHRSFAVTSWIEQRDVEAVLTRTTNGRNEIQHAVATCIRADQAERAIDSLKRARQRVIGIEADPYAPIRAWRQRVAELNRELGAVQMLRAQLEDAQRPAEAPPTVDGWPATAVVDTQDPGVPTEGPGAETATGTSSPAAPGSLPVLGPVAMFGLVAVGGAIPIAALQPLPLIAISLALVVVVLAVLAAILVGSRLSHRASPVHPAEEVKPPIWEPPPEPDPQPSATELARRIQGQLDKQRPEPQIRRDLEQADQVVAQLGRLDGILEAAGAGIRATCDSMRREAAAGILTRMSDLFPAAPERELHDALDGQLGDRSRPGQRRWRASDGTAQRVYLLMRIALGDYLRRDRERGPLLLDDVTSGLDGDQLKLMQEALQHAAVGRQVVLFVHDPTTLEWARAQQHASDQVYLHELTAVDRAPRVDPRLMP